MIRKIFLIVLMFPGTSLLCQSGQHPLEVKLQVSERSGIGRVEEPITFGVPLPEGQVSDTRKLVLVGEGGQIAPASFGVAQRWLSGSIRWLHVHTLISIPGNQDRMFTLRQDSDGAKSGVVTFPPLRVEATEDRVAIVTGPAKIVLSAKTPDIFEQVYFSTTGRFELDTQVVGGVDAGTRIQVGGRSYGAVHPGSGRIEILEQSAMRVVVLVSGQFAEQSVNSGTPSLNFEARVIAYAGCPRITMDYTIINRTGKVAADKADLEDLSVALSVPLSNLFVSVGGVQSVTTEKLRTEASIFQDSADHYKIQVNDETIEEGPGKSVRTTETGWINLENESGGVAVGICDFWQTWPKRIGVLAAREDESLVRIGLYPVEIGQGQELYIGQARTHRIVLRVHGGKFETKKLTREMAAANRPLRVVCAPDWYCRRSGTYGPIAHSGSNYGPFSQVARHYEQIVDESMDRILTQLHNGRTSRGITKDSYGWMNWGDIFFRAPSPDRGRHFDDPTKNLSWSGNYYDFGFAMLLQFMRTGDLRYLETGLRAGAYTADVFIVHYHPDSTLIGACHYCPPRYHAAVDNGDPYISRENNHAKVASVLARWQWLGDWWAKKVALEAFHNALTLKGADLKGWEQCRGNGHRLRILWLAYHFTGEKKYQEKAQQLIELGVEFAEENPEFDPRMRASQRFMIGIALEGLILHYWDTQDPAILETIKTVADRAYCDNHLEGYTANMAMAFGFLWKHTDDPTYLKAATEIIMATKPTDQAKLFGQAFRSTPWALGYLEDAAAAGISPPFP